MVCEPAACTAFLSPRQMKAGSPIFEQLVLTPNSRLGAVLKQAGADLIFHDCGELTGGMIRDFAIRLEPAVMSLGSSRRLWEDAALVPGSVVLYGNLPSKSFYCDAAMPVEEVRRLASGIVRAYARSRPSSYPGFRMRCALRPRRRRDHLAEAGGHERSGVIGLIARPSPPRPRNLDLEAMGPS